MKRLLLTSALLGGVILCSAIIFMSCQYPSGEPYPNTPPKTRLANIPANDTIAQYINLGFIPEQTLYWVGDDPDGFVVGYRFRWIDFHTVGYDTVEWRTLLNLTNITGTPLDTLVEVHSSAQSVARIYNFLATIDQNDQVLIGAIRSAIATGRWFAVPYKTGTVEGDSIKGADPIQIEAPNKGIFIFNSPADSNQHRFEVKAIDNDDAEDPNPPFVHFWTLRSPAPDITAVNGPFLNNVSFSPESLAYVLRYPTELAPGMEFRFAARDPSTDERVFSWVVDDTLTGVWSEWSRSASALVTALNLQETGSDTHYIHVRARNRWGSISRTFSKRFRVTTPPLDNPNHPRRTLLINNCRVAGGAGSLDSTLVNNYYLGVLAAIGKADSVDVWTSARVTGQGSFPTLTRLLQYTNILLVADNTYPAIGPGSNLRIDPTKQSIIREYLNLGGKMIYSGSPNIRNVISSYLGFAFNVLQIDTQVPFDSVATHDFIGAIGDRGYPDIHLDSAKVGPDSGHAMRAIAFNYPRGVAETISRVRSKGNLPQNANKPLGVRYLSPPELPPRRPMFSIVHFGFPLYFARQADVIAALRVAYRDLNESSLP